MFLTSHQVYLLLDVCLSLFNLAILSLDLLEVIVVVVI